MGMTLLRLRLVSLTCQFKLSFPLSFTIKVQSSWGWSFSLFSPLEEELPCQKESKARREKHHEESSPVTCGPLTVLHSQVFSLLQGLFLYFILRSQRSRKHLESLLCAAPLPGTVNLGSYLPADPSSLLNFIGDRLQKPSCTHCDCLSEHEIEVDTNNCVLLDTARRGTQRATLSCFQDWLQQCAAAAWNRLLVSDSGSETQGLKDRK